MRLLFILLLCSFSALSQDTLGGFKSKIEGEEINYFSPYDRFAKVALLTRCNGNSPISWKAPTYKGKKKMVVYELLLGHSTGTSTALHNFEITLNGVSLGFLTSHPNKKGEPLMVMSPTKKSSLHFEWIVNDANNDGFGRLFVRVPAKLVKEKSEFAISGPSENSRDWLMVFMYNRSFKIEAESTQLVTRKENKRQLNLYVDQPFSSATKLHIKSSQFDTTFLVHHGYNKLSLPVYTTNFVGNDHLIVNLEGLNKQQEIELTIEPLKSYEFHIIHHSHNDIGYSHIQTEVAEIQTANIRTAIDWAKSEKSAIKPIWHIESLWAVENFLAVASEKEINEFVQLVKAGNIVLSANYANVLTGLARPEELDWMVEYAKLLESKYGLTIKNAMITDIPGITREALSAYVRNGISYLCLGPNYVEAFADHGDRVGGVIRDQGDKAFYWKPRLDSKEKLLVWTGGKGYSFFHGVADNQKQERWEQKISDYCIELDGKNYPYDIVQLHYTKKSDNGPVDTSLCSFVAHWNATYSSPQLVVSSVDQLFESFATKYGSSLTVETGEISPYWEDGAFSTIKEEILNRTLSQKTTALELKAKHDGKFDMLAKEFYTLHRNIIMFSEHTWGSWCSISDPEIYFTTEQWKIKKSFVDSATEQYARLESFIGKPEEDRYAQGQLLIQDFEVDAVTGGVSKLNYLGKNMLNENAKFKTFEPIYSLGIKPQQIKEPQIVEIQTIKNDSKEKVILTKVHMNESLDMEILYTLVKEEKVLKVHYKVSKEVVKDKESMHIALPLFGTTKDILYGTTNDMISINHHQLPGSNREFICTNNEIIVKTSGPSFRIYSPQLNLFEIGGIINEEQLNGAKVWNKDLGNISELYLYVFNNYWHTNFMAYQGDNFEFDVVLGLE